MKSIKETVKESSAIIEQGTGKISKELDVFYNPAMKLNRDISVLLLNAIQRSQLQIADPLAGSGIRSIRFLKELKKNKIKAIAINDASPRAVGAIRKNLKKNDIKTKQMITLHNEDASMFILKSSGFDYIDIDPFGSPNPFLDAAVKRLSRDGILAVTATDTAPLSGTYPEVCRRKYWAKPLRNELMHEMGLRIFIRKVQLVGMQYDKALIPIVSYAKEHYMRIFFQTQKKKEVCDGITNRHLFFLYCADCIKQEVESQNKKNCEICRKEMLWAGPLWTGQLGNKELLDQMCKGTKDEATKNFLKILTAEAEKEVGFFDLHKIAEKTKKQIPKTEQVIKTLKQKGYTTSPTHFSPYGIKTSAPIKELIQLFGGRR